MTNSPTVSLIIVSRNRQAGLRRVLASLRFQSYRDFEVIVVADAPDAAFFSDVPHAQSVDYVHYDEANISAARNLGLARAQGEIVAFCDDDAVPDPVWLEKLVQPFAEETVASAGGFVRGRNGIEYQWKALLCDVLGDDHPLNVDEKNPYTIVEAKNGMFAKLQGTNCAFRRQVVLDIGGFDEGYRFFLDETDVCLRLANAGFASAFVPDAQVHHGFEQSANRSSARVPLTLFHIGASKARFLENHAKGKSTEKSVACLFSDQRVRLVRSMVEGKCEPRDVPRLMKTLKQGFESEQLASTLQPLTPVRRPFRIFGHAPPEKSIGIAGSTLSRRKLMTHAKKCASKGQAALVIQFSITSLFHNRRFDDRGFWVQSGGLFGRSGRTDTIMKVWTIKSRAVREFTRTATVFPVSDVHIIKMFRNFVLQMTESESS